MIINFHQLKESHFPLLLKWLEQKHIKTYWDTEVSYTIDLIQKKYHTYVQGFKVENGMNKPIHAFIIIVDDTPIGYIQFYRAYDFSRSKPLIGLPEKLGALDIFIGEDNYLGQNLGSLTIQAFLELYAHDYTHVFVDPKIENIAAIKSYEKAGFKRIAEQKDTQQIWMLKSLKKSD